MPIIAWLSCSLKIELLELVYNLFCQSLMKFQKFLSFQLSSLCSWFLLTLNFLLTFKFIQILLKMIEISGQRSSSMGICEIFFWIISKYRFIEVSKASIEDLLCLLAKIGEMTSWQKLITWMNSSDEDLAMKSQKSWMILGDMVKLERLIVLIIQSEEQMKIIIFFLQKEYIKGEKVITAKNLYTSYSLLSLRVQHILLDIQSIYIIRIIKQSYPIQTMGIKDKIKSFLYGMDMLSVEPLLRTIFGGIFSIIILVCFGVIFAQSFINVINKLQIDYQQNFQEDSQSSASITNVKIAIGITGIDFSMPLKKFTVDLYQKQILSNTAPKTTKVKLSLCKIKDWKDEGDDFGKQFQRHSFNQMYCIDNNESIELQGYDGTVPYKFLKLIVKLCDSSISGCDSSSNSEAFLKNYLLTTQLLITKIFIVNTIISPSKEIPYSKIIQKNILTSFSQTTATYGYINIGDFTITTDTSILPVESLDYITGTFIDSFQTNIMPVNPLKLSTSTFIDFNIQKSTKSMTITRNYGKIDTVLSYVGGLFSLLFSFIAFFFASYSQYSYELYIAEQVFLIDKNGTKLKSQDFTFLLYVRYCFYDWLSAFGVNLSWQKGILIKKVLEQSNQTMDIGILVKRIQYLQKVSEISIDKHKQIGLYLSKPPTIEQSQKLRQYLLYSDEQMLRKSQQKDTDKPSLKIYSQNTLNQTFKTDVMFNDFSKDLQCQNPNIQKPFSGDIQEIQLSDLDKEIILALRKLKSQNDEQSERIKRQILKQILDMSEISFKESNQDIQLLQRGLSNSERIEREQLDRIKHFKDNQFEEIE